MSKAKTTTKAKPKAKAKATNRKPTRDEVFVWRMRQMLEDFFLTVEAKDENNEPVNLADALYAIATAINRLADTQERELAAAAAAPLPEAKEWPKELASDEAWEHQP